VSFFRRLFGKSSGPESDAVEPSGAAAAGDFIGRERGVRHQFYSDEDPSCYYGSHFTFFVSEEDGADRFTVVEEDRGPSNTRPGDWIPETFTTHYGLEDFMKRFSVREDVMAALSEFMRTRKGDNQEQA
jgi:hypothetical protein